MLGCYKESQKKYKSEEGTAYAAAGSHFRGSGEGAKPGCALQLFV